jgi:DNA-binding transcriptional LysR family regulator
MFAWDDLRIVLAIARSSNLFAAAGALGVNHSTVFRRLNALERELGSKLFERLTSGYRPTESGARLIDTAERMEAQALTLDRELTGRDTRLAGKLRVTCSETLAFRGITEDIAHFRKANPGIAIELAVDNRTYDLSRREADVAFRAMRPKEGDLFGRKLIDVRWGIYASADYLAQRKPPRRLKDLAHHDLIGWAELSHPTKAASFIAGHVPPAQIGFRSSSLVNQMLAAKHGMGLAVLPCYLGDPENGLKAVIGPLKELVTELWIVTHASLKDTARVRAFMDAVGNGVKDKLSRAGR